MTLHLEHLTRLLRHDEMGIGMGIGSMFVIRPFHRESVFFEMIHPIRRRFSPPLPKEQQEVLRKAWSASLSKAERRHLKVHKILNEMERAAKKDFVTEKEAAAFDPFDSYSLGGYLYARETAQDKLRLQVERILESVAKPGDAFACFKQGNIADSGYVSPQRSATSHSFRNPRSGLVRSHRSLPALPGSN